jgi:hypothetical protein
MANVNIVISLPNGQETALIQEFAIYNGWTQDIGITAAAHAKTIIAEVIRESIKHGRVRAAITSAQIAEEQEVDAMNIS